MAEFIEVSLTSPVGTKQQQAANTDSQITSLLPCAGALKKVADGCFVQLDIHFVLRA